MHGIEIPGVNRAQLRALLQCKTIITDWQRYTGAYFCIVTCHDNHDKGSSDHKSIQMFSLNAKRNVHTVLVSTRTGNPRKVVNVKLHGWLCEPTVENNRNSQGPVLDWLSWLQAGATPHPSYPIPQLWLPNKWGLNFRPVNLSWLVGKQMW